MKDICNQSVLYPQESILCNSVIAISRLNQCRLASAVISITTKPTISKPHTKPTPPAIKALLTPLPEIPKSVPISTPPSSITLDQLLLKRICAGSNYREKVACKLLDLAIELNKVSKRLFTLKPSQVLINWSNEEVDIVLRR